MLPIARRRMLALLAALPLACDRPSAAGRGSRHAPLAPSARRHLPQPAGQPRARRLLGRLARVLLAPAGQPPPAPTAAGRACPVDRGARWPGIAAAGDRDSVTWLGHASFLIRLGGRTILTDPFLTERASPLPWFGPRRIAGPGLPPELLPPIDLLLLSHNHYDHLDLRALARLRGAERDQRGHAAAAVALSGHRPLRAGDRARLAATGRARRRRGSPPCPRSISASAACSTATPACGAASCSRPAAARILFTGDTAYGPVFAETAPRVAPPDLALVPIGAYEPRALMAGLALHARGGRADRPRLRRATALRHALGHHPCSPTSRPFEPPGRFRAGGAGRRLCRGRRLGAGDRRDAYDLNGRSRAAAGAEAAECS